jgi:hypothetical protein
VRCGRSAGGVAPDESLELGGRNGGGAGTERRSTRGGDDSRDQWRDVAIRIRVPITARCDRNGAVATEVGGANGRVHWPRWIRWIASSPRFSKDRHQNIIAAAHEPVCYSLYTMDRRGGGACSKGRVRNGCRPDPLVRLRPHSAFTICARQLSCVSLQRINKTSL